MPERFFRIDKTVLVAFQSLYLTQLKRIFAVAAIYYYFIGTSHMSFVAGDVRIPLMISAYAAAIVASISFFAVIKEWIPAKYGHISFIPTGLLGTVAVYLHVFLTSDLLQLTNAILVLFVTCFLTLSIRVFAGFLLLSIILFMSAVIAIPGPNAGHFVFMFIAGCLASCLGFMLRYRALYSAELLVQENAYKAERLAEANRLVEQKRAEAQQSANEAMRANKSKDAFLANTTHELRTPLTGVLGMLDVLEETQLNPEQKEALDAAQFSARSLLVIVNDILDIAKIEAGEFEFRVRSFDPELIIQQVRGLLLPKAQDKKNVLIVKRLTGSRKTFVDGDPVRIGQVLFNLVDNAIKFTDEGTVKVSSDLRLEGSTALLTCTVEDQGIGFTNSQASKLFKRFGQIDDTSTTVTGGTGLGLPISRELARLMDGDVVASAVVGKGAKFIFTARLKLSENQKASERSKRATILPVISEAPLRILIAEDVDINRMLIKKLLEQHAWSLEFANDGAEAMEMIISNEPYDLILMDIRMPKKDGGQVIHEVQAMESAKSSVPIIALTANAGPDDRANYLRLGAAAVVGKPIKEHKLAEAINRLIRL